MVGIVPSILYEEYGVKKTIFIGGVLLTIAHVIAALMLNSDKSGSVSTLMLFIIGIIGG